MDLGKIRFVSKKKGVASFEKKFRFQPEPERSSRGHGSIRLCPTTREGGTLASTSDRGRVALLVGVLLLLLLEILKREGGCLGL